MFKCDLGYVIYAIYFTLALIFRKQPHIAVLGIAVTDLIAYRIVTSGKTDE